MHRGRMPADQGWVVAKGSSVNIRRYPVHVVLVGVAARRRHFPQHRGACRHHREAGRRRSEHQPPAQLWILMRELLRDSAAPGHAGDVNLCVAELRNKTGGKTRQRRRAIRQERPGRTADAGHVEDDCRRARECFKERLRQLPVGADPIEQQQRRLAAATMPDRDLKQLTVDHDLPSFDRTQFRDRCGLDPAGDIVSQRRRSPGPHQASGDARCRARPAQRSLPPSAHAASRANQATSFPSASRPKPEMRRAHPR